MDRLNNQSTIFLDTKYTPPQLLDADGNQVVDFVTHPFVQPERFVEKSDLPVRKFLDAFIIRPSPGISMTWIDKGPEIYDSIFPHFALAIHLLTGKYLISVS